MTGLDLETFLRIARADLAAWLGLGVIAGILALLTWTSWGSRRALRKCLVLSVVAHLVVVTSSELFGLGGDGWGPGDREGPAGIREIHVNLAAETTKDDSPDAAKKDATGRGMAAWDRPGELLAMNGAALTPERPDRPKADAPVRVAPGEAPATPATPDPEARLPDPEAPPRAETMVASPPDPPEDTKPAPPGANEIEPPANEAEATPAETAARSTEPALPETDLRQLRPRRPRPTTEVARAEAGRPSLLPPAPNAGGGGPRMPGLPDFPGAITARPLPEVPEVYRPRLDPDRSLRAQQAGATEKSELAVERALDWLARHQDDDGRWNAGTRRDSRDDRPLAGESSFTFHCPPGEICAGDCYYPEADTAITGLALLTYLGAGQTHVVKGKYQQTVLRGLQFLISVQKPDGDLRGESRAVGMYCHAMASLALCEAYALTGDVRLRDPAERAVGWLIRARSQDGQAWRYTPGAASGDTSILGWVVLVLKSAKENRFAVPESTSAGMLEWLKRIAGGESGGLAMYRPERLSEGGRVSPAMTAEAWVCRQFLGAAGRGEASNEAATYLIDHPATQPGENVFYYGYYGTLALYQHGGPSWERWNPWIRDTLVTSQRTEGHASGSWDPQLSTGRHDKLGGRVYCTALATLTLEVYYRYLRLHESPSNPPPLVAPADPAARRAGRR